MPPIEEPDPVEPLLVVSFVWEDEVSKLEPEPEAVWPLRERCRLCVTVVQS